MDSVNPHIPNYLSTAPWYLKAEGEGSSSPSLNHQKKQKPNYTKPVINQRGIKIYQAPKYRKGACENCGAITHTAKWCLERPREKGAKFTNMNIAADENIKNFELDYDGKRDRWNGFDAAATYARVVQRYEARDEARRKYLKDQQLKKIDEDADMKINESKHMEFAKVNKRVRCTTDGGSTGTVRNLRIREDTAKYLLNLDINSAYYDPKSRSMREDPLPDADPDEKFYEGDNKYRMEGQALELKKLNIHAWKASMHIQAAPSKSEFLHKKFLCEKEKIKQSIMEKYGHASCK